MSASGTLERHDGTEVAVNSVKQLPGGGARIEIDIRGGATWTLDVTHNGNYDVVTCYDEHGQLADIKVPRWVEDDVLVRLH